MLYIFTRFQKAEHLNCIQHPCNPTFGPDSWHTTLTHNFCFLIGNTMEWCVSPTYVFILCSMLQFSIIFNSSHHYSCVVSCHKAEKRCASWEMFLSFCCCVWEPLLQKSWFLKLAEGHRMRSDLKWTVTMFPVKMLQELGALHTLPASHKA